MISLSWEFWLLVIFMLLTSGASQTQLPVCRFAYIFSLDLGSMISTHCVGDCWSFTAVVDLTRECIALYYLITSSKQFTLTQKSLCGTWFDEWEDSLFVIHKHSSIIWIKDKKYHNFRFLLSLQHFNCPHPKCIFEAPNFSLQDRRWETHPKMQNIRRRLRKENLCENFSLGSETFTNYFH